MNRQRLTRLAAALTTIGLFIVTGSAALTITPGPDTVTVTFTASDEYIPRPVEFADPADLEPRLRASIDLAANGLDRFIGSTCRFSVTAANGSSEHPNYGIITTNGDTTTILDTENEANVTVTRLTDADLTLGATINLYNVLVPDDNGDVATSVDYVVTFTCQEAPPSESTTTTTTADTTTTSNDSTTSTSSPPSTTTTTTPATTTTSTPTTSTTIVTTTSTSAPPTTTTPPTVPPTTATTNPPASSTSTTVPDTTTTTGIVTTTTTPTPSTSLPFTGAFLDVMFGAGLGSVLAGIALLAAVALARREVTP